MLSFRDAGVGRGVRYGYSKDDGSTYLVASLRTKNTVLIFLFFSRKYTYMEVGD